MSSVRLTPLPATLRVADLPLKGGGASKPRPNNPPPPSRKRKGRGLGQSDGFTLIEVLVSLTILSISLAVLLGVFSTGLSRAGDSESEMTAGALAQSLLNTAVAETSLRDGDQAG